MEEIYWYNTQAFVFWMNETRSNKVKHTKFAISNLDPFVWRENCWDSIPRSGQWYNLATWYDLATSWTFSREKSQSRKPKFKCRQGKNVEKVWEEKYIGAQNHSLVHASICSSSNEYYASTYALALSHSKFASSTSRFLDYSILLWNITRNI